MLEKRTPSFQTIANGLKNGDYILYLHSENDGTSFPLLQQ